MIIAFFGCYVSISRDCHRPTVDKVPEQVMFEFGEYQYANDRGKSSRMTAVQMLQRLSELSGKFLTLRFKDPTVELGDYDTYRAFMVGLMQEYGTAAPCMGQTTTRIDYVPPAK